MLTEFLIGLAFLILYFIICASCVLILRRVVAIPKELFRKTLHIILIGSVFILIYAFKTWWVSAAVSAAFVLIVFPILALAERIPGYSELLTERSRGEIKRSLVVVFFMYALVITACWGIMGEKYLVIASVLAWGFGDAAAALVGKRFGRHYITGRLVEGRKSFEGTLAMFITAFIAVTTVLLLNGSLVWYGYVPIAAVTAAVSAAVELYTKRGMDTLTCPLAAAAVLIPLVYIMGV